MALEWACPKSEALSKRGGCSTVPSCLQCKALRGVSWIRCHLPSHSRAALDGWGPVSRPQQAPAGRACWGCWGYCQADPTGRVVRGFAGRAWMVEPGTPHASHVFLDPLDPDEVPNPASASTHNGLRWAISQGSVWRPLDYRRLVSGWDFH